MKLYYIANARFPTEKAHGLQIAKTLDAFKKVGVEAQLVIPRRIIPKDEARQNPKEFYDLSVDINPIYLPCIDLLLIATGNNLINRLLYSVESVSFLLSFTVFGMLHRKILLYTRDPYLFFLLCFLRNNLFLELHTFPKTSIGRAVFRHILRKANGIVVTNGFLKEKVEQERIRQEKVLVAPNAADLSLAKKMLSKEEARRKLGWATEEKVAMYIGNFYKSKGVYILADAANRLPKKTKAVFVGGSRFDRNIKPLKNYIAEHNIRNATVIDFKKRKDLPLYLSASDVCVLPNVITDEESEYFTTPLKMFDYMIASCPIIASDLPAIRQILNESMAFIVTSGDPKALASGIEEAIEEKDLSEKKVKMAYKKAVRLSWKNRAKSIKKFLTLQANK